MAPATRKRKILWTVLAVIALGCAAFVFFVGTKIVGFIYLPAGSEKKGNSETRYRKTEGFGHTSVLVSLFYKRHRLTDRLNGFIQDPQDNERALYQTFCEDGKPAPDCGMFYIDGHTGLSFRVTEKPNTS